MGRTVTKAENTLIAAAVVIGLPFYGLMKIFETVGWIIPVAAVVAVVILVVWYQHDKKQKRLSQLRQKYQNEEVVQKIFNGYFWQGQTEEQLRDSLGPPVDVDHKLLKTKTKNVWKYQHQGANRFGLRITVENGYVTGWDEKT